VSTIGLQHYIAGLSNVMMKLDRRSFLFLETWLKNTRRRNAHKSRAL